MEALLRTVNGTHRLQRIGLRTVAKIVIPSDAGRPVKQQDATVYQYERFGLDGRKPAGAARSKADVSR